MNLLMKNHHYLTKYVFSFIWILCFSLLKINGQESHDLRSIRTCCEFQSQYNIEKGVCEQFSSLTINNVSFPHNFSVPSFLSMSAYDENLKQAVKFRLISPNKSQSCSSHQFQLSASLLLNNNENGFESINFTIEGYLKYGKDYFPPNEYCINTLNQSSISLIVCSTNQNCSLSPDYKPSPGQNPCIRRCCEFGQVYDFRNTPGGRIECKSSGVKQWSPILYGNDPYTLLNDPKVQPHFIASHPRDGWCNPSNAMVKPFNNKYINKKEIIRILQDGSFLRKHQAQTWKPMNKEFFCIDGAQNFPGWFEPEHPGFYSGHVDEDTIILDCSPLYTYNDYATNVSSLYGICMIISTVFLILTVLVYFLLWEKQNVHGWTILCYAISLLLAYVFLILMHFSNQLNLKDNGSFCRVIAVSIHFFFISTFCWLTTINFDLWWTFKVLKPTTGKSKGLKRFIFYSIFALGVPAIIVSTGLTLDFTFRDDIESDIIIPLYGITRCYLDEGLPMLFYLYGPIGVLLAINLFFFLFTIYSMYKIQQATKFASSSSSKNKNSQNQSVKLFFKLFIIMGVSWIFELISWCISGFSAHWYWAIFDLFNIFQAVFIFILFICKKETVTSLEQKFPTFKRCTNSVKIETATFNRVTTRFPKLKGVLTPFRMDQPKQPNESTNTSHLTDMTNTDDGGGQKFELTPKLPNKKSSN